MYFQSFYLSCLAHASYMVGSEGVAAVGDPQRDVEIYIEEAKAQGLRIAYVIETHLHADFVSGHHELASRTGAQICISERAHAKFPHRAMRDGDAIEFGKCRLQFLATPGHTPESMCITLADLEKSPEPWAVLTGDTLFIGDVGRPDLSPELTPQQLAGLLYDSVHEKLLALRDSVQVFPAHGAGSLCGRNISSERSSTIGRERQFNYALQPMSRDAFIHLLTDDLPERPGYFARDAEINRAGAEDLGELPPIAALSADQVAQLTTGANAEAILLDTRPWNDFAAAHIPGSINVALSGQFASWAGALIGLDRSVVLLGEDDERTAEARMRLARVGIERVKGYLEGGIAAWQRSGRPTSQSANISVGELNAMLAAGDPIQVLDVRREAEFGAGHIASANLVPLGKMAALVSDDSSASNGLLARLDSAHPVAVHCKGGYRSAIAASLLERAGFKAVVNVLGGFDAWQAQNLPSASGDDAHSGVPNAASNVAIGPSR
jgi:hydroxyacylglutathione hydrolase